MAAVPRVALPKEGGGFTFFVSSLDLSSKVTPPGRVLLLDRLVFEDGWPRVEG